jgi:hypothetical protein
LSGESYSPTARDGAQDFRNSLFEQLAKLPGNDVDMVLKNFAGDPFFIQECDWILYLIDRRIELRTENSPWKPLDVIRFTDEHESQPRSDYGLFRIANKRLIDIKDEVERGDISSRNDIHPTDEEPILRSWLARQLRVRSRGYYNVSQEEEIDLQQRPDLRMESPGINPVSIELKWADKWSLNELEDSLKDQLIGKYLRSPNSNYGIFVIGKKPKGTESKQYWVNMKDGQRMTFGQLVDYLNNVVSDIIMQKKDVDGVRVIGINFEKPKT